MDDPTWQQQTRKTPLIVELAKLWVKDLSQDQMESNG